VATKKVIDHNYPNNQLALDINEGTKTWWKFWESLAD